MGKSCLLRKSPLTVGGVTSFQRYEYLRIIQRKAKGHDGREWVMVTTASIHTTAKNITGKTTQVRRATLRARKKTHTPLAAFMHPSGPWMKIFISRLSVSVRRFLSAFVVAAAAAACSYLYRLARVKYILPFGGVMKNCTQTLRPLWLLDMLLRFILAARCFIK